MAQLYTHPYKNKLLRLLLLKSLFIICAIVSAQAQAPTISSFTPMSGRVGDFVEITGTNFGTANRVYFGSGSTTVFEILDNGTRIKVQVPVTANPGRIRVNNAVGSVYSKTNEIFAMPLAPTISSFSTNSGVAGDEVTITGTNLGGVTRVYFGNGNTTAVTAVGNSQLKVVVPATASTAKPILQSNEGRATSTVDFVIVGAPTITSFTPTSGAVGVPVTIKGANLEGATRIYFGSGSTTVFRVENGDIIVDVPPTATTGAVKVQTNAGQASRSTFTVEGAPIVTGISPLEGNAGTPLTITGENIRDAIRVYVGGGSTTDITVIDDNTIQVLVPAAASTSTVRVQTNYGQGSSSQTFTVLSSPVIGGFEPTSGPVGTVVTITGENLLNATSVSFGGGSTTSFISKSDTELKVAVPAAAYTGTITVVSTTGRHTSSLVYTVEGAPIVASFSPESGVVNSTVTITGQNLLNATHVYIGSGSVLAKDFISKTDNEISVKVPALASTGAIRVLTSNGQVSTTGLYTVESAPVITSFDPGAGHVGSPLTIYGSNFTGVTRVYVGSGSITSGFTINSSGTEIRLQVPNNATTGVLRVQTSGGQFSSTGTYVVLTPSITLTPGTLSFTDVPTGASEVKQYVISGTGLVNGAPIAINIGSAASPFTISTSPSSGFSRFVELSGVANNRLNATTIYVRYAPMVEGATAETIAHAQGATSLGNLTINAMAIAPMPVELASFSAKPKDKMIVLEWRTASETDNSHFEIEVSEDDLENFTKVSTVKSRAGTSLVATDYKYAHYYSGNAKLLYYRLKQVDIDGTYEYSKMVAVELSITNDSPKIIVAPNPLTAESKVILTAIASDKATLRFNSIDGKQALVKDVAVQKGHNEIKLEDLDALQSGMYILTVELDSRIQKLKVFKR